MRDIRLGRTSPSWRAVNRFTQALREFGFLPSLHFGERFLKRVSGKHRISAEAFARSFERGTHYCDTRPGRHSRIAMVMGIPVVYRYGGRSGRHIRLITVLPPETRPPYLRRSYRPVRLPDYESVTGEPASMG